MTAPLAAPLSTVSPSTASPWTPSPSTPVFGNDQFAHDAKWLYDHCPSGKIEDIVWPEKVSLVESLGVNPAAAEIVDQLWDDAEANRASEIFARELEEFRSISA